LRARHVLRLHEGRLLPELLLLCGFALGLLLRNQVAAQQRQQQLCQRGCLLLLGLTLLLGRLALQLDDQLEELDAALAETVHEGFGHLLLAALECRQQSMSKAAARPGGGNLLVLIRSAVFVVGPQRVVGFVGGSVGGFVGGLAGGFVCGRRGHLVVAHGRSSEKMQRNIAAQKQTGRLCVRRPVREKLIYKFRITSQGEITGSIVQKFSPRQNRRSVPERLGIGWGGEAFAQSRLWNFDISRRISR